MSPLAERLVTRARLGLLGACSSCRRIDEVLATQKGRVELARRPGADCDSAVVPVGSKMWCAWQESNLRPSD